MRNFFIQEAVQYFRGLPDEHTREYETALAQYSTLHQSEDCISSYWEIMKRDMDVSFEAFYCLEHIYRHNRDYSDLKSLIQCAERNIHFTSRLSFKHIRIMYSVHSDAIQEILDYDELLHSAYDNAKEVPDHPGFLHTFANAFVTICEKCMPENDADDIISQWYDIALNYVNRAIELEPTYAKFYSTKARIVALKRHFSEATALILRAIDKEDSAKPDYSLLVGDYQYYRAMIAMRQYLLRVTKMQQSGKKSTAQNITTAFYDNTRSYAFISYARTNRDEVDSLAQQLNLRKYNVWYDKDIIAGQDWKKKLGDRIIGCNIFILVVSDDSVQSPNVIRELALALSHGKAILPIYIEDTLLPPDIEMDISRYQAIQKFRMSDDVFYTQLDKALSSILL